MKKEKAEVVRKLSSEEKMAILRGEIALINKKHKREVISIGKYKELKRILFKSRAMNEITGGGVPRGRFTVIWGPKGSAKTTNCYDIVANAQQEGLACLWIDFERSFDPIWAAKQGVLVDDLLYAPAFDNAEQAMDVVIGLTKTKAIDVIVIDSIQGLSPIGEQETKKHVEKSTADDTMALLARKLSQFFRMSAGKVYESDCTVLLIGQTRMDLGGFITLEKLSGGHALEHWSSLTIHVRRGKGADAPTEIEEVEETDEEGNIKKKKKTKPIGFDMVARIDKSKIGADEGKECHVKFWFGKGIENT